MDLSLTTSQRELQARARAYVTEVLQPIEAEFERAGGRLSTAHRDDLKRAAIEARLHGGSFPRELGGQVRSHSPHSRIRATLSALTRPL